MTTRLPASRWVAPFEAQDTTKERPYQRSDARLVIRVGRRIRDHGAPVIGPVVAAIGAPVVEGVAGVLFAARSSERRYAGPEFPLAGDAGGDGCRSELYAAV